MAPPSSAVLFVKTTIVDVQTRVVIREGAFTDNGPAENRTAIPVELAVGNARGMRSRFERIQYFDAHQPAGRSVASEIGIRNSSESS